MKTMYKAITGYASNCIRKVEVARETEHFVIFENKSREAKSTGDWQYFDTFQEAKNI